MNTLKSAAQIRKSLGLAVIQAMLVGTVFGQRIEVDGVAINVSRVSPYLKQDKKILYEIVLKDSGSPRPAEIQGIGALPPGGEVLLLVPLPQLEIKGGGKDFTMFPLRVTETDAGG